MDSWTDDAALGRAADMPLDATDQALLAAVQAAATHTDPMPDGLVERAQFAVALAEVHEEVARIQRTSLSASTAVRSLNTTRQSLTLSTDDMEVVLVIAADGHETVRIDGWVTGGTDGTVELRVPDGLRTATTDAGRFSFGEVPTGMGKLTIIDAAGRRNATPTLRL